jgi:UDP-N-acetylmuramoyl-L-alanyl-D-glutamate--2,6-diaminopimelate ligase
MIDKIKKLVPNFLKVWYHKIRFLFSSIVYGNPHKKLKLIGVTGSSGKSTTSFMINHILKESGFNTGLISTIGAYIGDEEIDIGLHVTTPDAHDIPALLHKMVQEGVEYAVIEISSHALSQGRIGFLKFDISTITNITSDHLDWHKTWSNYADAKCKIIERTKLNGITVLNKDNLKGYKYIKEKFLDKKHPQFIDYSKEEVSKIKSILSQDFDIDGVKFSIPIIGGYNILNALAAIKVVKNLGINLEQCSKALETFRTLKGHMEVLKKSGSKIILDFAHNTDSLEKSLIEVENILENNGRIISLFGSAGLRDIKKRYDMGLVAAKYSDIVVVVPEDPRTESLYEINSEILRGCRDGGLELIERFQNREEYVNMKGRLKNTKKGVFVFDYENVEARIDGIELGIDLLKNDDILITQGKGHEQSLCFGTKEFPYDETRVITNLLKNMD